MKILVFRVPIYCFQLNNFKKYTPTSQRICMRYFGAICGRTDKSFSIIAVLFGLNRKTLVSFYDIDLCLFVYIWFRLQNER